MAQLDTVLVASAARTVTGDQAYSDSNPMESDASSGALTLDVTAFAGTSPTLNVVVEGKDPASDKWFSIATFAQKVGIGVETLWVGVGSDARFLTKGLRVRWTIAGAGATFTFSVGLAGRN